MQRDLGMLYRRLKYRDLYDAIADETVFSRLVAAGWFPFVEILGSEFRGLANTCEAGFELDEEEAKILARFDAERVERMFSRWMTKPHTAFALGIEVLRGRRCRACAQDRLDRNRGDSR